MPKTFPTQIAAYLKSNFPSKQFSYLDAHAKIGAVVGFLDLYDGLPHELIRLPPDEYAGLVAAIGTIRFAIEQFRATARGDILAPIPSAMTTAWSMIEKLPDEVPSASHDLDFITDPLLRNDRH